jgi:hypothetical protein
MTQWTRLVMAAIWHLCAFQVSAQDRIVDDRMHHLRNTGPREWAEFPDQAMDSKFNISFSASPNDQEYTLSIRQYDIKQRWKVVLNGQTIGTLVEDEKDLLCYLPIPPRLLRATNTLEISTSANQPDDIRVGEISLYSIPRKDLLNQSTIDIEIVDAESKSPLPSRLTIVNDRGILQPVSTTSGVAFANRPGYVYTAGGQIKVGVPAGTYTLYATRGPEYSIDSVSLTINKGDALTQRLTIAREVDTHGWVSCDTHIHTFTWSKHGDATSQERVITIAGEAIELPVVTDHNIHVDLEPVALQQGVRQHFTLIPGNEVTTPVGHFNIFPVTGKGAVAHNISDWRVLAKSIGPDNGRALILNHARDIHIGFRPFDPSIHLAAAGRRLDGWELPANAMEIINSGSQQSDQTELMYDWMGMINGGQILTPVGSSDSHDVSRYIVGQARTYIRCNDDSVGNIDTEQALKNFVDGNVSVSFGLITMVEVNDTYGPGELAPGSDEAKVTVTVLGPRWLRADRVVLYANGKKIREAEITDLNSEVIKWTGSWYLTVPPHDVFLVAVAEGPGPYLPFWPIAKPYQPTSLEWNPKIFGITGAVWIDADHNNQRDSSRDYATELMRQAGKDMTSLIQSLSSYDESVAVQVATMIHLTGKDLTGEEIKRALQKGSAATRAAFERVIAALPN